MLFFFQGMIEEKISQSKDTQPSLQIILLYVMYYILLLEIQGTVEG